MASVVSAPGAVAARPQLAARRSVPSAALLTARPQLRSLTAQMHTLSVRSPVIAMAAAADEPVEVEAVAVESEEPSAEVSTKEAIAILRNVRGSPSKVRRVLDTIRGRTYEEALIILEYMPYRACEPILKTLVSAASNAKHNYGMRKARLVVSTCYADMATPLKRVKPRAQGRANKIIKQQSHITIKVQEKASA